MKTALGHAIIQLSKLKAEDGKLIEDQAAQLERWVEHCSNLCAWTSSLEAVLASFKVFAELDEEPSKEELSEAISALPNGKGPGKDGIPAEIFKENRDVLPWLHALLLQCWWQHEIPHKMRDAKIVALYKSKGDKDDCNN